MIPATSIEFQQMDYDGFVLPANRQQFEIDGIMLDRLLNTGNVDIIDVREYGELPYLPGSIIHKSLYHHLRKY